MEMLKVENVSKAFDGKSVLTNISFTIKKGRFLQSLALPVPARARCCAVLIFWRRLTPAGSSWAVTPWFGQSTAK